MSITVKEEPDGSKPDGLSRHRKSLITQDDLGRITDGARIKVRRFRVYLGNASSESFETPKAGL